MPWQAPSIPALHNPGQPIGIRFAKVPGADGIVVFYEHEHATGLVHLLYVGR